MSASSANTSRIVPWPHKPFAMSFGEIAKIEGISKQRVYQIFEGALTKFRRYRKPKAN